MTRYWAYWKRGWWAWLLLFCCNITFGGVLYLLARTLGKDTNAYLWISIAAWLVLGAPLCGWLFEYFAARSSRLKAVAASESPVA